MLSSISSTGYWLVKKDNKFDKPLCKALIPFLKDKTVADFGCGAGRYVQYLNQHDIQCDGYDGSPHTQYTVLDLAHPVDLKQYDWILSLEVGEHIPKEYESTFIENIHKHNKEGVILSWAVKGQSGFGHVNCQNNDYIKALFEILGYVNDVDAESKLRKASTLHWFENTIMVFRR